MKNLDSIALSNGIVAIELPKGTTQEEAEKHCKLAREIADQQYTKAQQLGIV